MWDWLNKEWKVSDYSKSQVSNKKREKKRKEHPLWTSNSLYIFILIDLDV